MRNNPLPPFVLSETGIKLNDMAKIEVDEPNIEENSPVFPESGF